MLVWVEMEEVVAAVVVVVVIMGEGEIWSHCVEDF